VLQPWLDLILCAVPQILALMVDLEDDPEWSVADEIEEDDNDRYTSSVLEMHQSG